MGRDKRVSGKAGTCAVPEAVKAFGGGGKGGGGGRRPVESPDSLHSTAKARVLDIISEGPVYGPVGGASGFLKNYYLGGTPVENADGTFNFEGVAAEYTLGTQDQGHISGFPASESGVAVGTELKAGKPWVQTFTNNELSAVVVNIGVSQLVQTDGENMGRHGTTVNYKIELQTGSGAFVTVLSASFSGKTTNGYERSHRINLPSGANWTIRVTRTTPDSTTDLLANGTYIGSYVEVIDAKLRYPMTALIGVSVNAEQFSGIPDRAALWRGRIIKVPSNYDAEARAYSGVWDGTFKNAYSNNPAWVFYDLLLNDRYGLGARIKAYQIDRYTLYRIARYCDEMVPDGFGGTEPRFTCNVYIQKAGDAFRVIQDLASTFRGMSYWAAGMVRMSADIPTDPVFDYTNANVVDGQFTRTSSALRQRHTVAAVSYNDMGDFGRQKVEFVQDDAAVVRYGIREMQTTAFGCTSRGQAHRIGKYQLVTSQVETGGISFKVGLDSIRVQPGDVIRVFDQHRAGRRMSGRIVAKPSATMFELDAVDGIKSGDIFSVKVNGALFSSLVSYVAGNAVAIRSAPPKGDYTQAVWSVTADDLKPELYRVISIREQRGDSIEYEINAVQCEPQKFSAIDYDTKLESYPTTVVPPRAQQAPKNVALSSYYVIREGASSHTLVINWEKPANAVRYEIQFRRDNSEWVNLPPTSSTSIEVDDIYSGLYTARVRAINALDVPSLWGYSEPAQLDGLIGAPPRVTSLTTEGVPWGINLRWAFPNVPNIIERSEIRYGSSSEFNDATVLGEYAYPTNNFAHQGLKIDAEFFYWVRLLDKSGAAGAWYPYENQPGIRGTPSQAADEYNDLITKEILESALGEQLFEDIESIEELWLQFAELGIDFDELGFEFEEVDGKFVLVNNQLASMNKRFSGLDSEINAIEAQIAELAGTPEWDEEQGYLFGQIVKSAGALYRALQDVPKGTPVSSADYWEKIGDYDSLGEAVTSLVTRMTSAETDIDELTGAVSSNSTDITQLQSSVTSLDEQTQGNAIAIDSLETNVTGINGKLEVTSKQTNVLAATVRRLDDGEGELDTAMAAYENRAFIKETQETVATNEKAVAKSISEIGARIGDNVALISEVKESVVTLETAQAQVNQSLSAQVQDNASTISNVQTVIADLESSQATVNSELMSQVDTNASRISELRQTVVDDKSAQATVNSELMSQVDTNASRISELRQTVVDDKSAQATVNSELMSQVDTNASRISELRQTVVDDKSAQATVNQSLFSQLSDVNGKATANARAISSLQTRVTNHDNTLTSQSSSITALQNRAGTIEGDLSGVSGALNTLQSTVSAQGNNITSQGKSITQLQSQVTDVDGKASGTAKALSTLNTKVTGIDGRVTAQATKINQVESKANGTSATVQDLSKTVSGIDGKVQATRTIKVAVNSGGTQYMAGIGVGVDNSTGGMQSQVVVVAGRFSVMHNTTGSPRAVFSVQNGDTIINSALIGEATIGSAKIANTIQSSNWNWNDSTGWRLQKSGRFDAMEGNFGGSLRAASGTFSGKLTAQAINAVNTINIAGNAVSIQMGRSGAGNIIVNVPAGADVSISISTNGASGTAIRPPRARAIAVRKGSASIYYKEIDTWSMQQDSGNFFWIRTAFSTTITTTISAGGTAFGFDGFNSGEYCSILVTMR